MKDFGKALLRGLAYAIAFFLVFNAFSLLVSGSPVRSSGENQAMTARYWKDYESQRQRTEALLTRSEKYYDRMEANAAKQEELNRRLDAVISKWERK